MEHQLPPNAMLMRMLLGRFVSQAIGTAAKLGLADHLADGARSADDLAAATGANGAAVYRLLRALASVGIFTESEHGVFTNTPLSEALRDRPGSARPLALFFNNEVHLRAWTAIDHSVKTGESGFEHALGQAPWSYLSSHPETAVVFNNAMTALSSQFAPLVVDAYDFSDLSTLVDLGGGHGLLLNSILQKNPSLKGILFDVPHVIASAPAIERCEAISGDFLKEVPAGDAYVMKHIIHDWGDTDAVKIFETIHRTARRGTKLLLVESVIAPGNAPDLGKIIDLEMLVFTHGGRERTETEYRALLKAGGFTLQRVIATKGPVSVIESVRD